MTQIATCLTFFVQLSAIAGAPPPVRGRSRAGNPTTTQPGPALSPVSPEDLTLLVHFARRAFEDKVQGQPERASKYHPLVLAGRRGIVHLTLRSHGTALAEAESPEMDIVDASVAAGTLLGEAAIAHREDGSPAVPTASLKDDGPRLGIEFEWLGAREYPHMKYYGPGGEWTDDLLHSFEPAVEGIGVEFHGKRGWTRPAQIIASNYSPDLALIAAERAAGLKHATKLMHSKNIRYFRFPTYHLWQPSATQRPVVLVRGDTLVPPLPQANGHPTPAARRRLDAAILRMGRYLHYRQNPSGSFSYEYAPSADRYENGNSAPVQLRAIQGLAAWAQWKVKHPHPSAASRPSDVPKKASDPASDVRHAITAFDKYLQPIMVPKLHAKADPSPKPRFQPAGLALVIPGHCSYLEISARLLSAMIAADGLHASPAPHKTPAPAFAKQRTGLIEAILASQDEDGRINMDLRVNQAEVTTPSAKSEDTAAGWALLALAQADAAIPDDHATSRRIDRAMLRALSYVRRSFQAKEPDSRLSPVAAAAIARAFALHYAKTNDARLSDLVFTILDRIVQRQIPQGTGAYPELCGAVNAHRPGIIGADTAIYLAALADGLALAKRIGDRPRIGRYRRATLAAARFVMQLEVRKMGCYYIRSPRDALGGVRAALWDGRIRADHCAQALIALMRTRAALSFSD